VIVQTLHAAPTPAELAGPEKQLLDWCDGQQVAWLGRGSTALYYALRAAHMKKPAEGGPEVVFPAVACPCLVNVARLAGFNSRFADVDAQTGLLDFRSLRERCTANTRAVVFVHLFGGTADLAPLAEFCTNAEIMLIEDAAQALGGVLPNGDPVGSVGDFTMYSFGQAKMLDCGGGALCARTGAASELLEQALREEVPTQPLAPADRRERSASYAQIQRTLVNMHRRGDYGQACAMLRQHGPRYDSLYLEPFVTARETSEMWPQLAGRLEARRAKAERYRELLASAPVDLVDTWLSSGACWRFSLLVRDEADAALASDALRQRGFHASNLFWPLNMLFGTPDACRAAEGFGRRVLNLWVDETVELAYVEECAAGLLQRLRAK